MQVSSGLRWCPRQNGILGSQLRHHVGFAFASNQFVAFTRVAPRSTVSTVTTRSIVPRSTATRPFSAPCAPVWTPKSSSVPQIVVRTPVLLQSERVQVCVGGDGHWSLCHDFHRCLRAVVETLRCGFHCAATRSASADGRVPLGESEDVVHEACTTNTIRRIAIHHLSFEHHHQWRTKRIKAPNTHDKEVHAVKINTARIRPSHHLFLASKISFTAALLEDTIPFL